MRSKINIFLWICALILPVMANAQFNPENPPEPGSYELTTVAYPTDGGWTSPTAKSLRPGAKVTLSCSPYSNYAFECWKDEAGNIVTTDREWVLTMPHGNVRYTAVFKFKPGNPDEPGTPAVYGNITAECDPAEAGYVNGTGKYEAGTKVQLKAHSYSNYSFTNWIKDGKPYSDSPIISCVVEPGTNHYVAHFRFNPGNPDEPNTPTTTHRLNLKSNPDGASSFNISSGNRYESGKGVNVEAYPATGWTFIDWRDEDGNQISTDRRFTYTMPDRQATLTANLKYSPGNPNEPGSPTAKRDILYGARECIMPGSSAIFTISLENVSEITGINVDITKPDGLTLDIDGATLTGRSNGHTLTFEKIDDMTTRLYVRGETPIAGANGPVIRMIATAPEDTPVGTKIPVSLTKGVAFMADGSGVSINAIEGTMQVIARPETLPDSPDFVITDLAVTSADIMPGDAVSLKWNVENKGETAALSGWSELIFLEDSGGRRTTLGTLYYDTDNMAPGTKVSRQATLVVPTLPGLSGSLNVGVTLIPNATSGEIEQKQLNNTTMTEDNPVTLGKRLILTLPSSLTEGSDGVVRGQISRSGSWLNEETFTIQLTPDDHRLHFPTAVTIRANQSASYFSGTFSDNDELDLNTQVNVTADGNGYETVSEEILLIDDEFPEITLSLTKEEIKEGETVALTVVLPYTVSTDTEVKLTSDTPQRISIPQSVTVKSGKSSETIEITAPDNKKIDGDTEITIRATAAHYEDGEIYLTVLDDDIPALDLTLTPSEISEGDGPSAVLARLVRTDKFDTQVTVDLSDDSNGELYYPTKQIKLAPGEKSVEFPIGVRDNSNVDGNRTVNVQAAVYISSCSCSATGKNGGVVTGKLTILDNDGPTLTLNSGQSTIAEGDADGITVTLSRNTEISEPMSVSINSDADDILEYPATVIIPAGATSATFKVKAKNNDQSGDSRTIVITATAEGFTKGIYCAMVTDSTLPDARITDIAINGDKFKIGENDAEVTVTLANSGSIDLPEMVKTTIYLDGKPAGYVYNQKPVKAGEKIQLTKKISLPSSIGTFEVYSTVNPDKSVQELVYTNNRSASVTLEMTSPFTASVSTDKKVYKPGEGITLSGQLSGDFEESQEVEIYLINTGMRQILTATADANGKFAATFQPYARQKGHFSAGACYPGEKSTAEHSQFDILGVELADNNAITCELSQGEKYVGEVKVKNPTGIKLSRLKAEVSSKPEGCRIDLELPSEIAADGECTLKFELSSDIVSEGKDWEQVKVDISSAEGLSQPMTIYYYIQNRRASLESDVKEIDTTISWDEETEYPITITNAGKGETGKITLALPEWMNAATPLEMPSLASGESAKVVLRLKTNDKMKLNLPVKGQLGINCANGKGLTIKYNVVPVTDKTGTVAFEACDEYTYNTSEAPKVAGASVKVFSASTGILLNETKTGEDGTTTMEMKAGYYRCEVTAEKHDIFSSYFFVNPGRAETITADISYNPITIDWNVVETEVEDEYSIETVVKYETNVPMPVVKIIIPKKIDGDNMAVGDATMINAVFHNVGLIKALDVNVLVEKDNPEWKFEPLAYTEPFDLAPEQSVNVPIRITRIADTSGQPEKTPAKSAAETMFNSYRGCMTHIAETYKVICGKKIKDNEAAENMSMKMCATAATMAAIGESLSHVFGGGGGGGSIGAPSGGGGGGNSGGSSEYSGDPTLSFSICDECDAEKAERIIDTLVGKSWLGPFWDMLNKIIKKYRQQGKEIKVVRRELANDIRDKAKDKIKDKAKSLLPEEAGDVVDVAYDIYEITKPCENKSDGKSRNRKRSESKHSWMDDFNKVANMFADEVLTADNILRMLIGDEIWYSEMDEEKANYMDWILNLPENAEITDTEISERRPTTVTLAQARDFAYRMTGKLNDLTADEIEIKFAKFEETETVATENGHSNMVDCYRKAFEDYCNHFEEMRTSSVCASISLSISQTMTMTRQAFDGTLKVFNGHESEAMKDVKLNLIIRDEDGNIASSHEFQTNPTGLDGFNGALDLPGGWALGSGETGVAKITFIPTRYAAPEEAKVYSFGGTLEYIDPFTKTKVTRTLYPVELTVKPSPVLDMTYFMQRDIYGDDPLTTDVVEKTSPAEFALVINNKGAGDAMNVRMVTQQPQIVDNEKGLDITFEFVSSQLNGEDAVLAMGKEIATDFGSIPANSSAYAQWWLQSSLLGHFVDYDVKATHVTSYDNPDLTLLDKVSIHELIHGFTPETTDNKPLRAFLVNDITDSDDTPDMVYFSDATEEASVATASSMRMMKVSDTEYEVTMSPQAAGWTYGVTDDLAANKILAGAVRKSDGIEIATDNFWQTEVTLHDGKTPTYENRLHLVADIDKPTTYILTFEAQPETLLDVLTFSGLPDETDVLQEPLRKVKVTFNKPVNTETFTADDISLTVLGEPVDCSECVITPITERDFSIDFGEATSQTGYYVLTIHVSDIEDNEGYPGKKDRTAAWSQHVGTEGVDALKTPNGRLRIYPLPLRESMTIEGDFKEIRHLTVTDLSGLVVKSWTELTVESSVDISELSGGIYFIKVVTDGGIFVKEVVKQ